MLFRSIISFIRKMKKNISRVVAGAALVAPLFAFAQPLTAFGTLLTSITGLINAAIPVAFGLGILFFFWGLAKYILSAGDEEKKAEGRRIMIWGVVALAVMASVYGLIQLLQSSFAVNSGTAPVLPAI